MKARSPEGWRLAGLLFAHGAIGVVKEAKVPEAMHELSDKQLSEKLSSGELSEKKATIARAILRRRRQERLQAWFKRHGWLPAVLAALGLASFFSIRLSASDEASKEGDDN